MGERKQFWLILYSDVSVAGGRDVTGNEVIAGSPVDWLIDMLKSYPNTTLRGAMPITTAQYLRLKDYL